MKTLTVCKILDLTRLSFIRQKLVSEHLENHFDIDIDVFRPDPLFEAMLDILMQYIKDPHLLFWWIRHEPGDNFYSPKGSLEGEELETAQQLLAYYRHKQEE